MASSEEEDEFLDEPIPFALTPAQAITGLIDYRTSQGSKLYNGATSKLSEELFDCTSDKLFPFLKTLANRAMECGCSGDKGVLSLESEECPEDRMKYDGLIESYG